MADGLAVAVMPDSIAWTAIGAVGAAFFLTLAVRSGRAAILVGPAGVTGRGIQYTRRLAWNDIERFEDKPRKFYPGHGLGARHRDGTWVRLIDDSPDLKNRYQAAADELEAELGRRRTL